MKPDLTEQQRVTLRRAFHNAHVNVEALIDAYSHSPNSMVVRDSQRFLERMDKLCQYLLGEHVATLADKYPSPDEPTFTIGGVNVPKIEGSRP